MTSKIAKSQQIKEQERIIHVEEFSIKVSRRGQRVTELKSKERTVHLSIFPLGFKGIRKCSWDL